MKQSPKLDALDVTSIEELQRSRAWARLVERIGRMREDAVRRLISRQPEIETAMLRGRIEALDDVAKLPRVLLEEAMRSRGGNKQS